jgi:UDP-N-acetylmuramoyl-tripeptide--D-alanyl-D-alanine ligase
MNALAAAAAASAAGAGPEAIRAGLEALAPVDGRFTVHQLPGDITLIDDTYNANPGSLAAAVDVLAQAAGDTWLVLGDMGELGTGAEALHEAAGARARAAGITRVFGLGELARAAVGGFGTAGLACDSLEQLLEALHADLHGPLHILVKGSRRMRMERVVEALRNRLQNAAPLSRETH